MRRLNAQDRKMVWLLIRQIFADHTKIPDCKPLKGKKGYYRARFGNYRIIFRIEKERNPQLIDVRRRNEKTYKNL